MAAGDSQSYGGGCQSGQPPSAGSLVANDRSKGSTICALVIGGRPAGRAALGCSPTCMCNPRARTHARTGSTHAQAARHPRQSHHGHTQAGRQAGRQPSGSGTTPCTRHTTTRARPCTAGLLLRLRLAISARLPPLPRRQNTMGTHQRVEQALNPAGGRHVGRLRTRRPCPAVSALNISSQEQA
jgi:hypothetical protein